MKATDWTTWAQLNGYVHYGYKNGKPLLMKLPKWARPVLEVA